MNLNLEFATTSAWALDERVYAQLKMAAMRAAKGEPLTEEDASAIAAAVQADSPRGRARFAEPREAAGIAVIPIHGVIAKRASDFGSFFGSAGASVESLRTQVAAAMDDEAITGIVLDIDSPGGVVDGVPEFADELRAMRGRKPIIAFGDGTIASAAYWIAAQADRIVATKSSEIGSIGVFSAIVDMHRLLEGEGIDIEVVRSAPGKAAGFGSKLAQEDRDRIRSSVVEFGNMFETAVELGRGFSAERVAELADGDTHIAPTARKLGLIDEVSNFVAVVQELQAGTETTSGSASQQVRGSEFRETEGQNMAKTEEKSTQLASVEQLAAAHPELVEQIRANAAAQATESATTAERKRCATIAKRASKSQLPKVVEHIEAGADSDTATDDLLEDPHRNAEERLRQLAEDSAEGEDHKADDDEKSEKSEEDEDEDEDDDEEAEGEDDEDEDEDDAEKKAKAFKHGKNKARAKWRREWNGMTRKQKKAAGFETAEQYAWWKLGQSRGMYRGFETQQVGG